MIHDDDYDGSFCSTRFSSVLENMENGDNSINYFKTMFLWHMRLQKDHGEMELMILEHGMIFFLDYILVIMSLMMFHGSFSVYVFVIVGCKGFDHTNPMMDEYM